MEDQNIIDRENINRLYALLPDISKEELWAQVLYQAQNRYHVCCDESLAFYINQVVKDKIDVVEDATL